MGNILPNLCTDKEKSHFDQTDSNNICIENNEEAYNNELYADNVYSENETQIQSDVLCIKEEKVGDKYFLEKLITRREMKYYFQKVYYCSYCQIALINQQSVKCHYMLHVHQKYSFDDIIQFNFNKGKVVIKCTLCKKNMNSDEELATHSMSPAHRKIVQHFSYIFCSDLDLLNNYAVKFLDYGILKTSKFHPKDFSTRTFCRLCKTIIQDADIDVHIHEKEHCKELRRHEESMLQGRMAKNKKPVKLLNTQQTLQSCSKFYICFVCDNKSFDNLLQLSAHLHEETHKYKIRVLHIILNAEERNIAKKVCYCNMCLVNINTFSVIEHLPLRGVPVRLIASNKLTHLIKKKKSNIPEGSEDIILTESALNDFQILNKNCIVFSRKKKYICNICHFKMISLKDVSMHIARKSHQNELIIANSKTLEKPSNSANLNDVQLQHDSTLVEEDISKNVTFENSDYLKLCKSNLPISNDILDELVDFKLVEKNMKRLYTSKKSQLPNMNNNHNSKKNNIYHINAEEIRLLQLGVSFIVPFQSEKRICIPCQCTFSNYFLYDHLQCKDHNDNLHKMVYMQTQDILCNINFIKFYMVIKSNGCNYCCACGLDIIESDVAIHVNSENHILRSKFCETNSELLIKEIIAISQNLWYYAEVFLCDICKKRFEFELDFIVHLKSHQHRNKCNKVTGTILKFGVCPTCITCWYGDSDAYSKHCLNDFHKRLLTSTEFMVPNMPEIAVEALNKPDKIKTYIINESNKTINQEQDKELKLLQEIEISVKSVYPKAKAYIFGSRLSHLGLLDSDVDIFLDCENVYYNTASKKQSEKYLKSVMNLFENQQENWIIVEILIRSRVPIIKLRHIHTNLNCDISFSNGLSVEKSKLIKYFNIAFPICRQMILYLKKWLSLCRLSGSDGITTYAISWFVIFYLQIKGILPSVHRLLEINNESTIVDGWECVPDAISVAIPVADTDFKFEDLLIGFFLYYGVFDHCSNVICPFLGKIITKYNFANTNTLPEEMNIYKHRVTKDEVEIFRFDSPMCIQDPVDHSQNITKAVSKLQLRSFQKYCTESARSIPYVQSKNC